MNFTQFLNRNVKILARRFYSPSLKDVAWLEDAQLIFLIFHTFVCKFGWVDKRLDAVRGKKITNKCMENFKKISSATYRKATSFKLGECNLLPSILTLWKIHFWKTLFAIGFLYKHCNFWPLWLPVKMASETVIRSIFQAPVVQKLDNAIHRIITI